MGPVCRSHFDHARAGAGHDIRHAKGSADLNQFAARNDGFTAQRQRVEAEQHRCRIVVDDGRVFRTGQFAKKLPHMIVALAALACRKIEFKCDRVAHRRHGGIDRLLRKQRTAEVRVKNGPGQVEQRSQA